jgi:hypothetical protein
MGILENFENAWDMYLKNLHDDYLQNLQHKSKTVCENCQCKTESTPMVETDNMGREIFWEQEKLNF